MIPPGPPSWPEDLPPELADLERPDPVWVYLAADVDAFVARTEDVLGQLRRRLGAVADIAAEAAAGQRPGERDEPADSQKPTSDQFAEFLDGLHGPA